MTNYSFKEDDLFSREVIANNLTEISKNIRKPFSIAVDSSWGSGKSTFLRKWESQLKEKNHKTIFLDAWEVDYYKEPIIPLVGGFEKMLELDNVEYEDVKGAFLVLVKELVKMINPLMDLEKLEASFENEARKNYAYYRDLKHEKDLISNKLAQFADGEKVFVFIDELDRCKPSFSIQLMERVKHFLNIDNFVYVFAVDLIQLGESVKSVYGNINTDSYFRKFFDMTLSLPSPSKNNFFKYLFESSGLNHIFYSNYINNISILISNIDEIGLRECEKIFEIIRIVDHKVIEINGNEYFFPILIIWKVINPTEYKKFISQKIDIDSSMFDKWDIDSLDAASHIRDILHVIGPYDLKIRKERARDHWQSYTPSEVKKGLYDYACEILEITNLF